MNQKKSLFVVPFLLFCLNGKPVLAQEVSTSDLTETSAIQSVTETETETVNELSSEETSQVEEANELTTQEVVESSNETATTAESSNLQTEVTTEQTSLTKEASQIDALLSATPKQTGNNYTGYSWAFLANYRDVSAQKFIGQLIRGEKITGVVNGGWLDFVKEGIRAKISLSMLEDSPIKFTGYS